MNFNSPIFEQDLVFHSLLLLACFLVIIVFLLWRAFEAKKRSNISLRVINKEIEARNREIVAAQEEIIRKNLELTLAKETAESASRAKQNFLSNMSHEIRTPLNAILGFADILIQEPDAKEKASYLEAIRFSGENLLFLVNDILDIAKIEEGKIDIQKIDFNLAELVKQVTRLHEGKAAEKGIRFTTQIDPSISLQIIGDPVRLTQVLNNLLSNALKFTENGSVALNIFLKQKSAGMQNIIFQVSDTGVGILPEHHDSIFERFSQGDSDTTRKYGGSGLGLTITRHLLKLQDSDINFSSSPGAGSTFYFNLEFGAGKGISYPINNIPIGESLANNLLKNKLILLAEDNEMNLKVARRYLEKWEMIVETAMNGNEAMILARDNKYDIILMDLQMPVMDGYESIKQIRNNNACRSKDAPAIAITADVMIADMQLLFFVGFNDYIPKPFNPDELKSKMIRCLAISRSGS
jgi:signal transduction histidine kinase/ActR/RegA family two-component response regulator